MGLGGVCMFGTGGCWFARSGVKTLGNRLEFMELRTNSSPKRPQECLRHKKLAADFYLAASEGDADFSGYGFAESCGRPEADKEQFVFDVAAALLGPLSRAGADDGVVRDPSLYVDG